jgi:hypothetical protein
VFISDQFAFLELHKTGCTHIRKILNELLDGELVGSHNQAHSELFTGKRKFLGSIRDPWEWYLSLWAFGCDKKGGVFNQTYQSENSMEWQDTYKNVHDAEAFRKWLHMMNDVDYLADLGEGYCDRRISRIAGLMTYRYLILFCTKRGNMEKLNELSTLEQIKEYDKNNCFIDHFIQNETLEADLFHVIETYDPRIPGDMKSKLLSRPRTNTSTERAEPEYYYDIESENLVTQRESLIHEKFGYVAPSVKAML